MRGVTQVCVVKDPAVEAPYHAPSSLDTWLREQELRSQSRRKNEQKGPRSHEKFVQMLRGDDDLQRDGRRRPRPLFLDLEEALSAQEAEPMSPSTEAWQSPAPPARGTPPAPAGLTGREVEVLRLIAQGWTDAQIAEHLVISPRTVNHHTTSLYSKLGVSSRAAATRYALEHHML